MLENIKTSAEAATILKLTQEYVAWLCRNNKFIGAIKKGKTWLIPNEAIKIYVLSHGNKKMRNSNNIQNLATA